MKNIELLCRIAMHIRTVPECDFTRSSEHAHKNVNGCLICEAVRAGLLTKADPLHELEFGLFGSEDYFGVSYGEWNDVILASVYANKFDDPCEARRHIPGYEYYNAIVDLLDKHGELDVLRRMEAEASMYQEPAWQSFEDLMAELNGDEATREL